MLVVSRSQDQNSEHMTLEQRYDKPLTHKFSHLVQLKNDFKKLPRKKGINLAYVNNTIYSM